MLELQWTAQFELYDQLYRQFGPYHELVSQRIEKILADQLRVNLVSKQPNTTHTINV